MFESTFRSAQTTHLAFVSCCDTASSFLFLDFVLTWTPHTLLTIDVLAAIPEQHLFWKSHSARPSATLRKNGFVELKVVMPAPGIVSLTLMSANESPNPFQLPTPFTKTHLRDIFVRPHRKSPS